MKYFFSATIGMTFFLLNFSGCDKKTTSDALCNQITLNKPFTAKIGELWCLDQANFSIRFGPVVEDSRCNVANIECVWAGRFVMAATIVKSDGEVKDTFNAVYNWTDTLHQGNLNILLKKVYPEIRPTMEALDPSKYSFDVVVSEE